MSKANWQIAKEQKHSPDPLLWTGTHIGPCLALLIPHSTMTTFTPPYTTAMNLSHNHACINILTLPSHISLLTSFFLPLLCFWEKLWGMPTHIAWTLTTLLLHHFPQIHIRPQHPSQTPITPASSPWVVSHCICLYLQTPMVTLLFPQLLIFLQLHTCCFLPILKVSPMSMTNHWARCWSTLSPLIEQSHYFCECSLPIIYSLLICCLVYKHQWWSSTEFHGEATWRSEWW